MRVRDPNESQREIAVKALTICLALWATFFAPGVMAQSSLKQVRMNGAELNYIEQGKGVAVIFVHGVLDDYRA